MARPSGFKCRTRVVVEFRDGSKKLTVQQVDDWDLARQADAKINDLLKVVIPQIMCRDDVRRAGFERKHIVRKQLNFI